MLDLKKRLQIKNPVKPLILNLPLELKDISGQFPVKASAEPGKSHDFIMLFATSLAEAQKGIRKLINTVTEDGMFWFCYPKQSSKKYKSDINRDKSWALFEEYNYRPVTLISLDENWSAMRFRDKKFVGK